MKKFIAAIILSIASAMAFALPSPHQIEQALMANDAQSARAMTQEVLREKPEAAKAHLFNAYILEHFDHNKVAAAEELKNVQRFDKKGDTKGSALFGKVVAELENMKDAPMPRTQAVAQPVQRVSYAQAPSQSGSHTFVYVILGAGVFLLIGVLLVNRDPKVVTVREYHTINSTSPSARSYESDGYVGSRATRTVVQREYVPQPVVSSRYDAVPQQVVVQPQMSASRSGSGMGMMGTAAAVAGGVVAGELLHDALAGGHHHSRGYDYDDYEERRRREREQDSYSAPAPAYEPPAVDYESRASSFSSGSSSSWDSGSSSSSSYDSGSSSSSWDSGSSYSDSSSSSSDW